jgi:hypothetical protein
MSTHCWVTQQRLRNPLLSIRDRIRYATVGKVVFIPCYSEPREVEDRAVASRTAPERFQGNDL